MPLFAVQRPRTAVFFVVSIIPSCCTKRALKSPLRVHCLFEPVSALPVGHPFLENKPQTALLTIDTPVRYSSGSDVLDLHFTLTVRAGLNCFIVHMFYAPISRLAFNHSLMPSPCLLTIFPNIEEASLTQKNPLNGVSLVSARQYIHRLHVFSIFILPFATDQATLQVHLILCES